MVENENVKENAKKGKRLSKMIVALICAAVLFVVSYFGIIAAQYVEFNRLDKSLAGETVAIDKDVTE